MDELYKMKKDALEELKESLRDYPDQDDNDRIFEIADSSIPIYTGDILQLAADNINLAIVEPEIGPTFDGTSTPVNIITANIYEEILQELWSELDNINQKAQLLISQGGLVKARDLLLDATERAPDDPGTHICLGDVLSRLQQTDDAIAHYQIAVSLNPNSYGAHYQLATLLLYVAVRVGTEPR